jgi:hypothetical protein
VIIQFISKGVDSAIEVDGIVSIALNLSNDDTSMDMTSRDLMKASYPDVQDFRSPLKGYSTLLHSEKAKKLLNWKPQHAWRNEI